jgi:peptidoglycan hydrolase-like protein with peptidoglycan-binding domain
VSKQITLVTAKLASLAQTPGMTADVQKLQTEVNQIAAKMGDLLDKKNSEINKEDVKKAATRLAEIPTEADKIAEKMLKQDSTNKEAAAILVQALGLVQDAKDKEIIYLQNKEGEETTKKADLKATVVEYNPEKTQIENGKVKDLQELIFNKFKNIKSIAGLSEFKKMGTDGKFGPSTAAMIKRMKAGYGLENPSSPDITNELYAELRKDEVIKESRVLSFGAYTGISEDFDIKAALSSSSSQPASQPASKKPAAKDKPSSPASSGVIFKEGSKGPEVQAIQNAVSAKVVGSSEAGDNTKKILATFGPITKQAVMDWQKANGFTGKDIDGIVGPSTIKKFAEMKNLGKWTASVISKLAGSEVKPFVKSVISDDEMKEVQQAAMKIISAVNGTGTDEEEVLAGLTKIKNKKQFDALNTLFSETHGKNLSIEKAKEKGLRFAPQSGFSSVEAIINNEMGTGDLESVKDIVNHLKSIGIKATFGTTKDQYNKEYFKENSFKIA